MIGISKEKALEIGEQIDSCKYLECSVKEWLLDECVELDPWLPIDENTPEDTRFLVLFEDGNMEVARLIGDGENACWISNDGLDYDYGLDKPTHYKELPIKPGDIKE